MAHFSRHPLPIHQIVLFAVPNIHSPAGKCSKLTPSLTPPKHIRMRPNWLILFAQKRIRVELVRMQRPILVVLDALSRNGVLLADGYLGEDVVGLDGDEYVVCGDDGSS